MDDWTSVRTQCCRLKAYCQNSTSGVLSGVELRLWSLLGLNRSWYGSPRGAAGSIWTTALVGLRRGTSQGLIE